MMLAVLAPRIRIQATPSTARRRSYPMALGSGYT